jgi:hypothetical protein
MALSKIDINFTNCKTKVWWRFEIYDFIGYTNEEKITFDNESKCIEEWWIFCSKNPRFVLSKEELFEYYKNLSVFIGLNIEWKEMPYELNELNWNYYLYGVILNEEVCEKDKYEKYSKRTLGRPLGSKNKLKNLPTTLRRSYRIAYADN